MSENYYNILGVNENASQDEIKQAYRKMSLKYHPDKNRGDTEASSTFQKISEAYENIGSVEKRREYNAKKNNPFNPIFGNEMGTNVEDLFANFFGGGQMGGFPGGLFGGDMDHLHSQGGIGPKIHIFHNGSGGPGIHFMRGGVGPIPTPKPSPIVKNININMEQVLMGSNIPVEIERWVIDNGNKIFEKENIYINIPKGIDENEMIILSNKGNVVNENCKGDVKLIIKINNNTEFERNGLDLIMHKNISLKDSLCGFTFELKYINNKVYTINNNSGNIIPPDYKKIIPNMGLTRENHVGNLCIIFHVIFPEKIADDKIVLLKDIL
jgi:DnaJ-class molecular chaperone